MFRPGMAKGPSLAPNGGTTLPLPAGAFANPTAQVGLAAVNGSAVTAMRSDGAPALSQSISPTWTGTHTFSTSIVPTYIPVSQVPYLSKAKNTTLVPFSTGDWTSLNMTFTPGAITRAGNPAYAYRTSSGFNAGGKWLYFKSSTFLNIAAGNTVAFGFATNANGVTGFTGFFLDTTNTVPRIQANAVDVLTATTIPDGTAYTFVVNIYVRDSGNVTISYVITDATDTTLVQANSITTSYSIPSGTVYYGFWVADSTSAIALTDFETAGITGLADSGANQLIGNPYFIYDPFTGSLGIGTNAPLYTLDVWGSSHFTGQPLFDSLLKFTNGSISATTDAAFNANKELISLNITGTGFGVRSASPTFTGTIGAASMTLSASLTIGTTLGVTGVATFTVAPIFTAATANTAAAFNGSKNLVSVTNTGTANNVLSDSPTLTGTIGAASMTLSASLTVGTTLGVTGVATFTAVPRFNGGNTTGAGAALLGANSPAVTLTDPYTWITVTTNDGSTAYFPVWK